jgi:spectinomycin phosphotransferase
MLEKPDIPDEQILACLRAEYGLPILQIAFLPIGGDASTAVYRAVTGEATSYFCKLKRHGFDPVSVALPAFLSEQGNSRVIPPLRTRSGELWAVMEEFHLILYPFVEGTNGYDLELTERQWSAFGAAIRKLHTTGVPPALQSRLRREGYSPEWRDLCRVILERLEHETFQDAVSLDLVLFFQSGGEQVRELLRRAEELAPLMARRPLEFVVCHSDIHPGNLFIDGQGSLFLVDWDYPMLAPKERDLMFIGGGEGFKPYSAAHEERLFYRGYGQAQIDPLALAYFRCERAITDFVVESERILSDTLGDQDRARAFEYLGYYFLPGGTIEMALATDWRESSG